MAFILPHIPESEAAKCHLDLCLLGKQRGFRRRQNTASKAIRGRVRKKPFNPTKMVTVPCSVSLTLKFCKARHCPSLSDSQKILLNRSLRKRHAVIVFITVVPPVYCTMTHNQTFVHYWSMFTACKYVNKYV